MDASTVFTYVFMAAASVAMIGVGLFSAVLAIVVLKERW